MSGTITVQNIQGPTTGSNANQVLVPSGHTLHAPGHVIQVQYGEYHTQASGGFNNTTFAPITTAQATITPKFSNSKIFVQCNGSGCGAGSNYEFSWHLKRGSTWIGGNSTAGTGYCHASAAVGFDASHGEAGVTSSFNYLDSPNTTSATTYILGFQGGETATYYVNRGWSSGPTYNFRNTGGCTITLMEIAQ